MALGLTGARLVASSHGELVFTSDEDSAFVDVKRWPPEIVVHSGQRVMHAARGWTGRWLVNVSIANPQVEMFERTDLLRWYTKLTDAAHSGEAPEPVAGGLDGVDLCGDIPLVIPRDVGRGTHRWPVARRVDWAPDTTLPRFDKAADDTFAHATRSVQIPDGPVVTIWNGHLYAAIADGFVDLFDDPVTLGPRYSGPVPAPDKGVYALQAHAGGIRLLEARIGSARDCLPGVDVIAFRAGPPPTLIVETARATLLFDPIANEVAELDTLVKPREAIVAATAGGGLVVFDPATSELRRIMKGKLAKLPRRPVDAAPAPAAPPPVAVLDEIGAASRTEIAGVGDAIVACRYGRVRFYDNDIATVFADVAQPIAVAMQDHAAVLAADGTLFEIERTKATTIRTRFVADAPRSLAVAADGRWIVTSASGITLVDATRSQHVALPGAITAAADPGGAIVIVAEERRLALWENQTLVDIPESIEQLVAIAPLGNRRFACAGQRNLFLLDLAHPELEALYEQNATPFLATSPNGQLVAWATRSSATVARLVDTTLEPVETAHYPATYTEPGERPLEILGLAFIDNDRLAVAVQYGGNILDVARKKTKKLDPHYGDRRSRWLFTFAGTILIAEDP